MLNAVILPNGNLKLTAGNEARAELADRMSRDSYSFWSVLCDGLEAYSCNGSFEPFDAGDANPFVGLTSAPCVAETMDYLDDGTKEIEGRFWYFADYMIACPLEQLRNHGRAIFTLAPADEDSK